MKQVCVYDKTVKTLLYITICLDTQLCWLAAWYPGKSNDFVQCAARVCCWGTPVHNGRKAAWSVSFLLRSHYHWGSWTWYMISRVWCQDWSSTLTVHNHWEQQNEPWQLSSYLMYLHVASWGSNYTWIWMYLLDQCAENFVHLWNHALAGLIYHFTVLRGSSWWSCEIMYHALPTFLHLHHIWIIAILFSKYIALLSTNTKACQGVARDS